MPLFSTRNASCCLNQKYDHSSGVELGINRTVGGHVRAISERLEARSSEERLRDKVYSLLNMHAKKLQLFGERIATT